MGKRQRYSVETGEEKENEVEGIFTVLPENWTVVTQAVFYSPETENGKLSVTCHNILSVTN